MWGQKMEKSKKLLETLTRKLVRILQVLKSRCLLDTLFLCYSYLLLSTVEGEIPLRIKWCNNVQHSLCLFLKNDELF